MDWPYIAGFFDGEGCICISKRTNRPICTISQTDGPHLVLEKIKEFLRLHNIRSSMCSYDRSRLNPKHKSCKLLLLTSSYAVEDFLTNCLPYLLVKLPKAEIALKNLREPNRVKLARNATAELAADEYARGELGIYKLAEKYSIGKRRLTNLIRSRGIRVRKRWEHPSLTDPKTGRFVPQETIQ